MPVQMLNLTLTAQLLRLQIPCTKTCLFCDGAQGFLYSHSI